MQKTKLKIRTITTYVIADLAETKEVAFRDHQAITNANVLTVTGEETIFI